ncbi:DUF5615 family PIN-like protein [Dyadobacter sp. CY261]|uniref:DUF5615 family PIN-like protein n=1 Tax=Dyadobacter sp. CY261 TaxID=2907203 RepID=UPI0038D38CB6
MITSSLMYVRDNGYEAVTTLDEDFIKLINQLSQPPKIIWIRTGNISTKVLSDILSDKAEIIKEFIQSADFDITRFLNPDDSFSDHSLRKLFTGSITAVL